eukprot:COSAG01_NODE_35725_length_527_cov_1.469626_1_plen_66_part_10
MNMHRMHARFGWFESLNRRSIRIGRFGYFDYLDLPRDFHMDRVFPVTELLRRRQIFLNNIAVTPLK